MMIFQDMFDDFDDFLDRRRQKQDLEDRIKQELETEEKVSKQHLERCYQLKTLSDEHMKLKEALKDCTEGKASEALMRELHANIFMLQKINHSFMLVKESIRVKSGWF